MGFDDFFRSAYPKVVAALIAMGFDREEAADSASEAMIQMLDYPGPIKHPRAWVTSVAIRVAARNAKRARLGIEKSILAAFRDEPRAAPDEQEGWLDYDVVSLLDKLSPGSRQVIALYSLGYQTREIANVLGKREATVRSHLRHARDHLMRILDESSAVGSDMGGRRREWSR